MLKLENWGDFFKFNKELHDDDFNRDQSLVVKSKTKSTDGTSELSFTYKQGVPDENKDAKIGLETKVKSTIGGSTYEGALKQDGSITSDVK